MERKHQKKSYRQSPRAGARARGGAREVSIDDLRSETARRAIVAAGPDLPAAPMIVAACALLVASGRQDFSENEIRREVDALAGALRSRVGFTPEQEAEALVAWLPIRAALRRTTSAYGLWIKRVRPIGVAGGRLWLAAPRSEAAWFDRRYRPLAERVADEILGTPTKMGTLGQ